jgi:gamma-glutamyl-gamma-aminobutyrate hydrolase PuuD
MSIALVNQYEQFRDYLQQLIQLSEEDNKIPKITQKYIASALKVSAITVSRFLNKETEKSKKMLDNFKISYKEEFEKWPKHLTSINRKLTINDVLYFLKIPSVPVVKQIKKINIIIIEDQKKTPQSAQSQKDINTSIFDIIRDQKKTAKIPQSKIAISYRGSNFSHKDGEGILFDHARLQKLTSFETCSITVPDKIVQEKAKELFLSALKQRAFILPKGNPDFTDNVKDKGLLVIPGRTKAQENEPQRLEHEYRILRDAFNRGQPVLGICAGAWRVYELFSIWSQNPDQLNLSSQQLLQKHKIAETLVDVTDHVYSGGMIRLAREGIRATYNIQLHDIEIDRGSHLYNALNPRFTIPSTRMSVNSVHWKAINPTTLPTNIKISSTSRQNPTFERKNRQKLDVNPDENSVESFETVSGAPILGIQWHPEGYDSSDKQSALLKYMAEAGNSYFLKRQMLNELNNCFARQK